MRKLKLLPFRASYIWAAIIALAVFAWMQSDDILPYISNSNLAKNEDQEKVKNIPLKEPSVTVNALVVKNELTPLKIRANGVTKTLFEITVVSRRRGLVKHIEANEGSWVNSDDLLVELDKGTLNVEVEATRAEKKAAQAVFDDAKKRYGENGELEVQLRSARADVEAKRKNYEITKSLVAQGVQTELALSQKKASLKASETRLFELQNISKELELSNSFARLKAIDSTLFRLEEQLSFTKILAPQAGWLEEIVVESGEFIDENRPVARILGLQELILDLPIPQVSIGKIQLGDPVEINFEGLGIRNGKVNKIAATANQATRTFTVEIRLDNSDGKLRAGMSAEAGIIVDMVESFKISPAHLNVNNSGQLYVKTVKSNNTVKIVPVQLVRTEGNLAFISGIQNGAILLTTGQAFLNSGDLVNYSLGDGEGK